MYHDKMLCPNCSRPMQITRSIPPSAGTTERHVFECRICMVAYVTEDHVPVSGERG